MPQDLGDPAAKPMIVKIGGGLESGPHIGVN